MSTTRTIFDIETAGLPEAELQPFMPEFAAPANYKDAAKIEAYIAEAKKEWLSKAALSPVTGKVIAIGYRIGNTSNNTHSVNLDIRPDDEKSLLSDWWKFFLDNWRASGMIFVGFNIKRFDLPFLIRRSWKNALTVPTIVRRGRNWDDAFIDLYEQWQLGDYQSSISLDNLSKFLGIGQKSGSGADFAGLPRDKQEEYLSKDLELTAKAAAIMLPESL